MAKKAWNADPKQVAQAQAEGRFPTVKQSFTLEECKRLNRAIWKTVNYIADDCGEASDNELIEMAIDADRMLEIGEPRTPEWLTLYKRFIVLPDKDVFAIAKMRVDATEPPRLSR